MPKDLKSLRSMEQFFCHSSSSCLAEAAVQRLNTLPTLADCSAILAATADSLCHLAFYVTLIAQWHDSNRWLLEVVFHVFDTMTEHTFCGVSAVYPWIGPFFLVTKTEFAELLFVVSLPFGARVAWQSPSLV